MADGTKVGSAYVEVTPKAAGNFASVIDSEVSKGAGKGSAFGDAFSGGMKGAIGAGAVAVGNILSDMVQSGVSAARDLVGDAFSGFADFEQLSGGVEKLFGDDAAQAVMDNANRAFQSAGISANEYMEQVTSFSASLISSLDGDTKTAANMADVAMSNMSDNANTFGTDIESIQNAYQGFAKGNFTMLDNLKLGYGGTKEEMERLLRDAEEIEGFTEGSLSTDNFADIVAAIDAVQTSMSISGVTAETAAEMIKSGAWTEEEAFARMGTTAREASETVDGSMNAAKAAWDNWVAALGNPDADMSKATDDLISSLATFGENALPVVTNIVDTLSAELPGLVATMTPVLVPAVTGMISSVLPAVVSMLPALLGAGMQLFGGLLQAAVAVLPQIASAVVGFAPVMLTSAGQMLITLVDAAVVVLPQVAQTVISNGPTLLAAGMEFFAQLGNALGRVVPMLFDAVVYVVTHLPEIVINGGAAMLEAGANLLGGFVDGILGMEPESTRAGTQAGTAASDALAASADGSGAAEGLVDTFNSSFDFSAMEATAAEAAQAATDAATVGADGTAIAEQLAATTSGSIDVTAMSPKATEMVENAAKAAKSVDVSGIGAEFSQKAASGIDVSAMTAKMQQISGMTNGLSSTSTVSVKADLSGVTALQGASSAVASSYKAMGAAVDASMKNAARSATSAATTIKSAIAIPDSTVHVHVARGSVQLPHFSMSGSFDPKTKAVPTVSVSWWANGAIFDRPTIFANGVGDSRGPEAVMPIEKLPGLLGLDGAGARQVTNIYVDGIQASPESQLYGLLEEVVEAAGITRRRRS